MGLAESEALVLRTYNLAEADKIVVCLTRNAGLIRAVAKGSRRIKNRFGAALEPFTLVNISYFQKENQELVSLRQAEILKSHFDLLSDPHVLAALAYVGDLLVEFSPPHQTNDKLFRMVRACLDGIAEAPQEFQLILRYFEVWILKLEGFLPDLLKCAGCHQLFSEDDLPMISGSELSCRRCVQGKGEVLSRQAYLVLRSTQSLSPPVFVQQFQQTPERIKREIAELTHQIIGRVLERRPRVQPMLQSMPQ